MSATSPKVSFVVPCYKLAHLLPQCIHSILSQSYKDFEIIIMDDCSPDDTAEVAALFVGEKVKHIRNEQNLGHLKNYNKGIAEASGKYVWLMSADDFLRRDYVLEQYVELMENNPTLGYVFCPALKYQNFKETEIVNWSIHGDENSIFRGHEFLKQLVLGNCVVASTGMVRKECYDKFGAFPLNMPNSGDWYLWCLFALHYDVGYLAEPMVCYRLHDSNMNENFKKHDKHIIIEDNFLVRWTLREKAKTLESDQVVLLCDDAIATYFAHLVVADMYQEGFYSATLEECEGSIDQHIEKTDENMAMRARLYGALADQLYLRRDFEGAREYYKRVLTQNSRSLNVITKMALLDLGGLGVKIRDRFSTLR